MGKDRKPAKGGHRGFTEKSALESRPVGSDVPMLRENQRGKRTSKCEGLEKWA